MVMMTMDWGSQSAKNSNYIYDFKHARFKGAAPATPL
jgi:hypothetical protein